MKNLIYQYWRGNLPPEAQASKKNISAWAEKIGAEHIFEINPKFDIPNPVPTHYAAFRPVFYEEFDEYDNILFLDCDIFTVEGLDVDIFSQGYEGIGIVDEPHKELSHLTTKSHLNTANDERWASCVKNNLGKEVIRNKRGNVKIFNTGVVLYTRAAIEFARKNWISPNDYAAALSGIPKFYFLDQNYLIYNMIDAPYTVMDPSWNCFVHYDADKEPDITGRRQVYDGRTKDAKLIHVQLRGADNKGEDWHYTIVNEPVEKWDV